MQPLIDAGELAAIGVVQEQHPDRAALYRQWRELPWPVLVDSLGLVGLEVVPVPLLLDEAGVVRATGRELGKPTSPEALRAAIQGAYATAPAAPTVPDARNREPLERSDDAEDPDSAARAFHRHRIEGNAAALDRAIRIFEHFAKISPEDPTAQFRLGVALRARADGPTRKAGDAQRAVTLWQEALAQQPGQYIWRRRLQQYGPSLTQPYSFYDWIEIARAEITERGEVPIELVAEPRGAELADPRAERSGTRRTSLPDPDPEARVPLDVDDWISVDVTATPQRVRPGDRVRIRFSFRAETERAHWNNEADPLRVSLALPTGVVVCEGDVEAPQPPEPESSEERVIELELELPEDAAPGELRLPAYALYYACDAQGVCRYLRREVEVRFTIDAQAERIR